MKSRYVFISITWCLVFLVLTGSDSLHAQTRTLAQCSTDLQRAQQAHFDQTIAMPRQPVTKAQRDSIGQELSRSAHAATQAWADCVKGLSIPAFSASTLTKEPISSSALAGKIAVINFWFMGCPPCLLEFPALNRLVTEYTDKNVIFIGFSTDKATSLTTDFFDRHPFYFKIIADAKKVAQSFAFIGYPTTFIVNQEGKISQTFQGGPTSEATQMDPYWAIKAKIDGLLAAQK